MPRRPWASTRRRVALRPRHRRPARDGDGERLAALLGELGCQSLIFFTRPLATLFGNKLEGSSAPGLGVQLVRAEGPSAKLLFPDTQIVGPKKWAPLQQKRVRYK